jgi:hypothetical protein
MDEETDGLPLMRPRVTGRGVIEAIGDDGLTFTQRCVLALKAELDAIRNGDVVVMPKNRQHAAAMHLIAERWLADNKQ